MASPDLAPDLNVDGPAVGLTIDAPLQGARGYAKNGKGRLTLSGASTYTGLFAVEEGTLVGKGDQALGSADDGTAVDEGATLDVQANIGTEPLTFITDVDPPTLGGRLIMSSGTGRVDGTVRLNFGSNTPETLKVGGAGTLVISGAISGQGGVEKIGPGKAILSGTNTFTGPTTVTEGILTDKEETPPPVTPPVAPPSRPVSRPILARLVRVRSGKRGPKPLYIVVVYGDTGEVKSHALSPFQAPRHRTIRVTQSDTNADGVADTITLSAKKGRKTQTRTFAD